MTDRIADLERALDHARTHCGAATERAHFHTPPESVRRAWCAWLRHHTIDPEDVALPGFVEADYMNYRITYVGYDHDDQGNVRWDGDDVLRVVRVVQLEARPSRLPEQEGQP